MGSRGPAPNPASRRQTGGQAHSWVDLPSGGYTGPIPDWPMTQRPSKRELEMWQKVWRKPQAAVWALNEMDTDVAMYVRYFVQGETEIESAKEARMWSDRLGLNPLAMLRNKWRVRPDETAEKRDEKAAAAKPRRRLKVADDSAVAGS